jgi:DNA-binding LytR/AlgR family response regulator
VTAATSPSAPGSAQGSARASAIRALVVDDEPAARSYLVGLLGQRDDVEVIGEADDATSALRILHHDDVQAVFLDVRMPGLDGMDLARVLNRFDRPPAILFVTAYEEHAVDAFGVHAFDYLLKPVDPSRLGEAVRRLQQQLGASPDASLDRSIAIESHDVDALDAMGPSVVAAPVERSAPPPAASLAVDKGGRTVMIDPASVLYVEAAKDYCRLRTADDSYLLRMPISTLEAAWMERGWMRVHRSYLVPVGAIGELRQDRERGWLVRLGRIELPVSRRHLPAVRDRLHRSARALRGAEAP